MPSKLENKWHLWKYQNAANTNRGLDWLNGPKGDNANDVGWGRRIYDKNEIEVRSHRQ